MCLCRCAAEGIGVGFFKVGLGTNVNTAVRLAKDVCVRLPAWA